MTCQSQHTWIDFCHASSFVRSHLQLRLARFRRIKQLREALSRRLQPIPLIVLITTLNAVESVDHPPLLARVLLTLVQKVAVDQHQRSRLDLSQIVNLLLDILVLLETLRPLLTLVLRKRSPLAVFRPHEPVPNRSALVASRRERETSVLSCCVFEGIPETDGRGRVGIEEDGVLVRRHAASDFGLLADDHGLKHAGVFEVEVAGDGGILLGDGGFGEGGVEVVQVVADFVDGAVFGLVEGAVGVESVW